VTDRRARLFGLVFMGVCVAYGGLLVAYNDCVKSHLTSRHFDCSCACVWDW